MDIEKYTSGKIYAFFEWAFRLVVWNVLTILIVLTVMAIPYYIFYNIQDNNLISNVEINDTKLIVTQKNDRITELDNVFILNDNSYVGFESTTTKKDNKNLYVYEVEMENFTVTYELEEVYGEILYKENSLYGKNANGETLIDDQIIQGEIKESNLNRDNELVLTYENKTINFGRVVETESVASLIWLFIAVLLGVITFIPCFVTMFSMIKIYGEEKGSGVLVLFFDRLWDNFKSLYKVLLIFVPIACLFMFSTYYYYSVISQDGYEVTGIWVYVLNIFTIGYNVLLVSLIIMLLWLLNLPMSLGYFRMNTKTILRFTLNMTFKNILFTFIYLFSYLIPLLLCVINGLFIPLWFVCGISLPMYLCYIVSKSKYRYLVYNVENLQNEMKEDSDIYKFTDKEKGEDL